MRYDQYPSSESIGDLANALYESLVSATKQAEAERTRTILWIVEQPGLPPGGPSDGSGQAPPLSPAEEAIRERQRRTRERWTAEREQVVQHRHDLHVHVDRDDVPGAESRPQHRDVVDAEVIDEPEPSNPTTPEITPTRTAGALPPASPSDPWSSTRSSSTQRRSPR